MSTSTSSSTLTLYDITIPVFIQGFRNLSAILDKASAHADSLPSARLVPDMQPFTFQIQTMSNVAKAVAPRLIGIEAVPMADDEATFEQLKERIAKTIEVLEAVPKEGWSESLVDKEVVISLKKGEIKFRGLDYVNRMALPNFYFHETMAYALIRQKGVDIGKFDFLGKVGQ